MMVSERVTASDDVAILHKHYPERGGAERVADELARAFDAPVYTAYDNDASADDVDVTELFRDSALSRLITHDSWAGWLARDAYYYLHYDRVPEVRDYDIVIQSGAATSWYVPPDDQLLIRYVHSPPRTCYDRFGANAGWRVVRWYSRAVRALYPQTASYPDMVIANSELVARRLRRYLGIDDVRVVYPPVGLPDEVPDVKTGEDYLALSRLAPNKGFNTIIDAFRGTEHTLRIAGDGPERDALEARASGADNIEFLGYVSEGEKARLLAEAKALIYAAENEDFGLVPMEAFACGTPVIGVDEGFTRHQVREGFSGVLFERGVEDLRHAIARFEAEGVRATADDLQSAASMCSKDHFRRRMRAIVDEVHARERIQPMLWGSRAQLTEMNTEIPPQTATAPDGGME